ncbi:MAG: glycosyl transferase [Caldilineae bacterium]|nr:MAG: glycosyl transferase [Caldilineae bacterium]
MSAYGYFDDQQREYVIIRPDTPLPWINYLGSERLFGLISNTAGGYTFYRDARLRRLTRYRYNNVPTDYGGRYLYLRDDTSGEFWSPSWQPTRRTLEDYRCHHGLGYSIIGGVRAGIEARTTYFIPRGADVEVWRVVLTNHRAEPAALSLFSLVEFALWDAWDDATNFQRNFNTGEVEVEGSVIYHKTEYRERRNHFAYFACSEPLAGFETQREAFLGPYRGWECPLAVERGETSESIAHGWAPVGVHHIRLELPPRASHQIIFLLGYHENPPEAKFSPPDSQFLNKSRVAPLIERYLKPAWVDAAFADLQSYWEESLGILQVETPDEHTNRMVNIWNAYQCQVTFHMSRSASFFESGIGRGMGFRDSNQDLLGFVQQLPNAARQRLLDLAATQLENGGAYHQYQPLTKQGNDAIGSGFNDDPLWLVLAISAYLKETGDWSILDEQVVYENTPGSEAPLYEHMERALRYTLERLGPHGLPLIGRADWNDCLNLNCFSEEPGESFQTTENRVKGDVAESIFIAGLFVLAAREMAAIARHELIYTDAESWEQAASEMEQAIAAHGWDGNWFLRAYDASGHKVGSHTCPEGQIYIEPQGICIMAGVGLEDGRARLALEAVAQRLATPHGIVLLDPAYSRYYLHLGEISSYPPGYKENGGIFCHTNPWIMIAETMVGNGDRAFDYYRRINPSAREEMADLHRCEPYVYAQMIAGKEAPTHGEAKNSWLTGTAAWNYVAITQWILGIRPRYEGLEIRPVIPASWQGFRATRKFRGAEYHIEVVREAPGNHVVLEVNGRIISDTVVPLPRPGQKTVHVRAKLTWA